MSSAALPEDELYDSEEEEGASQWQRVVRAAWGWPLCYRVALPGAGPSHRCTPAHCSARVACRASELVAALHLATYVPLQVIKMYVERPRALLQPVKEHFPATVLFADISGFTKIAGECRRTARVAVLSLRLLR